MGLFKKLRDRRAWNAAAALEQEGRLREARDAYQTLGTPEALVRAGALSARVGELGRARQILDEAVKVAPESADAWFHLATTNLELRDTARADECFHEALKRAPDRADILYAQAVYYGQKMPRAGFEAARRIVQLIVDDLADPIRRARFEALGFPRELPLVFIRNLSLEQQLVPEAKAYFAELAAGGGPLWLRVAAHTHLGLLLANTGQYREAADQYRRALALNPELHEAHYNLAMAHMRLMEFDAARTEMSLYARLHPRSPVTTFGMALLAETRGQLAETARLYAFFLDRVEREPPHPRESLGRLDVPRTWVQHAREIIAACAGGAKGESTDHESPL